MEPIKRRIEKFRKILEKRDFDAFLVLVEQNRRYLSGYAGEDTQFDETAGALFITKERLVLATDSRYDLQAEREAPLFEVVTYKKGVEKEAPSILEKLGAKRLGFESVRLTHLQYGKLRKELDESSVSEVELVPAEDLVETLRIVKEEGEIEAMKAALRIAESVFHEYLPEIKPGMTEKQVAWELEKRIRENGGEALSFSSIVASGPNGALPHAIPTDRKIAEGEPLLFDWGVKLDGYCSDISRTVVFGRPDKVFKEVFQTVYDAQRKAIEAIKPGMTGKEADRVAREFIDAGKFKDKFNHSLGHGVGLAVHESPRLSPLKEDLLEPGMVFTVEPGIYLPEWGGVRLENMVVLREHGAEVLNETDPALNYVLD